MKIEPIKSPGCIEAWLVEEHAVPILVLRIAFDGGSAQDPVGKEGTSNFLTQMLVEGAGDLTSTASHERAKDIALRIGFRTGKDALFDNMEVLTESRAEQKSWGRSLLDKEAVEVLSRASPFPRPPSDLTSLEFNSLCPSASRSRSDHPALGLFPQHSRWLAVLSA